MLIYSDLFIQLPHSSPLYGLGYYLTIQLSMKMCNIYTNLCVYFDPPGVNTLIHGTFYMSEQVSVKVFGDSIFPKKN